MPIKIFFCYAHEDEPLLNKLKAQLSPLQWQGLIDTWHDRNISAGTEWEEEIKEHLDAAQIILLMVSPDFMASRYCYSVEMKRAIERHERKETRVIPVILRPVYWRGAPFGNLQALPTDAKPVTSSAWPNQDEALFNVAEGIRNVVEQLTARLTVKTSITSATVVEQSAEPLPVTLPERPKKRPKPEPRTVTIALQKPESGKPTATINFEEFTLLHTLTEHTGSVNSIAIGPNDIMASGSDDKTIKVWDLHTGELLRSQKARGGEVMSVAISPDGQILVSGHSAIVYTNQGKGVKNRIKVWNLHTGEPLYALEGDDAGEHMTMSPDGQLMASVWDGIKVWDLHTGELLRTLKGHSTREVYWYISDIKITPDGESLVSASHDRTARVWNLRTGELLRTLRGHIGGVASIAISPDRQTLAIASEDIELWNLHTGKRLRTIEQKSTPQRLLIWSLVFSPDGQTLIGAGDDNLINFGT